MTKIDISKLNTSFIDLIHNDWALVTAGSINDFNMMTISWGGIGFLWNKPVVYVFVRPERYTFEYLEREAGFTLSFFNDEYRDALMICGTKSGRDCNKISESGLTPLTTENKLVAYHESKLILECKKMYSDMLNAESFVDKDALNQWYGAKGALHKMYVAEIENAYVIEQKLM